LSETSGRLVALRECVQQLGAPQQELLEQAYSDEQSIRQLANRLGQAAQTIYNRLFRIRRILFDCVEKRLATETPS
jgi:RNA polymerase sigma-70 factor (ECF subfamily)